MDTQHKASKSIDEDVNVQQSLIPKQTDQLKEDKINSTTSKPFLNDIKSLNQTPAICSNIANKPSIKRDTDNNGSNEEEKNNDKIVQVQSEIDSTRKQMENTINNTTALLNTDNKRSLSNHNSISSTKKNKNISISKNKSCTDYGNLIYDVTAISISIADLATDLFILYEYYTLNRTGFFTVSCIILCLAQLAYCFAFTAIFSQYKDPFGIRLCTFISCLPFAPFLSFIFYFAADSKSKFSQQFLSAICRLNIQESTIDKNASKFKQWVELKLRKHVGFIMEAVVEAFPQSIIQMIAIVYYQEADIIAIISILISMLSVSSKSLIFSRSIDPLTFIWNWLCCVTDFFGIFFTISWVFYNPHNDGSIASGDGSILNGFSLIGKIWIFKILICVLPVVSYSGLGIAAALFFEFFFETAHSVHSKQKEKIRNYRRQIYIQNNGMSAVHPTNAELEAISYPFRWKLVFVLKLFIYLLLILIGVIFMYCCGVVFVTLIAEIGALTFLAVFLFQLTTERLPHHCAADHNFWLEIFKFVQSASNHKIYGPRDQLLRVLAINRIIDRAGDPGDNGIRGYLGKHERDIIMPYYDATWMGLKESEENGTYLKKKTILGTLCWVYFEAFKEQWSDFMYIKRATAGIAYYGGIHKWRVCVLLHGGIVICLFILMFILMPLYGISRFLNILFPIIIVIWLYVVGNLWNDIDLFQYSMLTAYGFLLCLNIIIGAFVFKLHNLIWYIMPGHRLSYIGNTDTANDRLKRIKQYYMECTSIKEKEEAICQQFGDDIGAVILKYLPRFFDDEDNWLYMR